MVTILELPHENISQKVVRLCDLERYNDAISLLARHYNVPPMQVEFSDLKVDSFERTYGRVANGYYSPQDGVAYLRANASTYDVLPEVYLEFHISHLANSL